MTDHIWTQEQIATFLADGLDAAETERFQAHVRDCAECFTAVEAARAFDGGLANLFASARPSPMLEDRTVKALRAPATVPARTARVWGRRALMGLAATLVIGAFGAVTSLVIANGGLPMPGESFAWGETDSKQFTDTFKGAFKRIPAPTVLAADDSRSMNANDLAFTINNTRLNERGVVLSEMADDRSPDNNWRDDFSKSTERFSRLEERFRDRPLDTKANPNQPAGQHFNYYAAQAGESKPTDEAIGNELRYRNSGKDTAGKRSENTNGNLYYELPQLWDKTATNGTAPVAGPMSGSGGVPGGGGAPMGGPGGLGAPSSFGLAIAPGQGAQPGASGGTTMLGAIASGPTTWSAPASGGGDQSGKVLFARPSTSTSPVKDGYFVPVVGKQIDGVAVAKDGKRFVEDSGAVRSKYNDGAEFRSKLDDKATKDYIALQADPKGKPEPKPAAATPPATPAPAVAPAVQQPVRKIIIRSGDIEFEVESFDSSVATITLLVTKIPNAYVGTVNSEKLANGKVKGSVVVRVPPEALDGLVLELRKELGKTGELKGQKIGSTDITKMYTDLESRLKAARAMELRLLAIIKDGKGEIKQLLEAEKELGIWRTKIEEYEGEIRYYGNLASLSTLTITVAEKEIRTAVGITENERVQAGVEVEDVDKAFREAMAAVLEAKGRVTKSELKQLAAGQFNALLNFEVAPDASGPLRDRLKQLGRVARLEIDRVQTADGGPPTKDAKVKRGDTVFQVQFYNLANIAPRETAVLSVAVNDVAAGFRSLRDAVEKAKGRVVAANVNEGEKINVTAQFDFEIKRTEEASLFAALAAAGDTVSKTVSRAPESDTVTDTKILFRTALFSSARLQARETTQVQLAVADIPESYTALQDAVEKAKGRIVTAQLNDSDSNAFTQLDFELKRGSEAPVLALLASTGESIYKSVTKAAESTQTTDSKVMTRVTFLNVAKLQPRETTTVQYAVTDIPTGFRAIKEIVEKSKGRIVNSQLNENDKQNVTAQLDFEVKRGEEAAVFAALNAGGDILGRQTSRQAEAKTVSDTKTLVRLTFANANRLKPRETTTLAVEVSDVEASAAVLAALVNDAKGRVVDSNIANDRTGRVTAKLVYDVPLAAAAGIAEKAKAAGTVRVQQTGRDPSATDGKYATARLDIVLSNVDLIVPKDDGVWPQVRKGLSYSASALLSSLSWVIFGLCVVLPWMVVGYIGYRLVRRATKKPAEVVVPVVQTS